MAQALDSAVFDVLTADKTSGSLHSKVGGRIYPSHGDPGDDFPIVVFEQIGSDITHLFGGALMYLDNYQIRVINRHEEGLASIADLADIVVGLFNGTTSATAPTNFDRAEFTVVNSTDIDRADELLTATVNVTVRATQTSGL
tara:strand:+ start:6438 stop:6863 length:426 start_codon:yes stop_codon:yes gene_type:complete